MRRREVNKEKKKERSTWADESLRDFYASLFFPSFVTRSGLFFLSVLYTWGTAWSKGGPGMKNLPKSPAQGSIDE
jgi:hypothetical protein